ncbi:MAG: uracil phosphoribosyltransferase [Planctomycetota bacterium]
MEPVILQHPLAQAMLTRLRQKSTSSIEFRSLVRQLTTMLGLDATQDLPTTPHTIQTPVATCSSPVLDASVAIVPILRAGIGMAEPLLEMMPQAVVRHLGLFRDENTLQPVTYYEKLPGGNLPDVCLVVDPMLATGGTAIASCDLLREWGVQDLRFLGILGAPEGVDALRKAHPEVRIHLAAVDERLNEHGYILPGLGDAGDRQYNTL